MISGASEPLVFGPIPSRRLGMSLGVNNVYQKYCSYSCMYCQAGHTTNLVIDRREFYDPNRLVDAVVRVVEEKRERIDVVSFVPNGEPTLDINLGREASMLKKRIDRPLAVFTNSSLIYRDDVRNDLMEFDIVSVKIDAATPGTWRRINRPHPSLVLEEILEGLIGFSREYHGKLITETMLVAGINDSRAEAEKIASIIKKIDPAKAYISVPIRPPADPWAKPPSEDIILMVYNVFREKLVEDRVELLVKPEKPVFGFSNDLVEEIAKTILVHPIRVDYVYSMAEKRGIDPELVIKELLDKGYARILVYQGKEFIVPRIRR